MKTVIPALGFVVALAGCGTTYDVPGTGPAGTAANAPVEAGSSRNRAHYAQVRQRIKPAAEALCREEAPNASRTYCNFRFEYITDPDAPPNAFQTLSDDGRPLVIMTDTLLQQMRSDDEIAMVLAHEAAHHIATHIPKQQQNQVLGAILLGGITAVAGGGYATQENIEQAMNIGASVAGRAYSQTYELEADWLGAFIAARAGYDPERGAQIFGRPALASSAGGTLLSTHPASPQRRQLVARATDEIRRQQAAGLVPKPAYADGIF